MRKITINGKEFDDFTLGADPEMRIRGFRARPYLPEEGKFGADGPNSQIAELRPSPHHCPINLVYEIQNILRDGWRRFPKIQSLDWLGGTYQEGNPLGGHIHFGSSNQKDLYLKLDALDRLLAPVCMMLEETEQSQHRRGGTQYGKLAVRCDGRVDEGRRGFHLQHSYGGYEYRPLGSWLVSKQIACGVLSLAKVIGFETHNESLRKRVVKTLKFIPRDAMYDEAYMNCDKQYFAKHIPTIYRIVKKFTLYPKYDKYIDYLFHLVYQDKTWDSNRDLKSRWNIVPPAKAIFKKIAAVEKISMENAWNMLIDNEDIDLNRPVPTGAFF